MWSESHERERLSCYRLIIPLIRNESFHVNTGEPQNKSVFISIHAKGAQACRLAFQNKGCYFQSALNVKCKSISNPPPQSLHH